MKYITIIWYYVDILWNSNILYVIKSVIFLKKKQVIRKLYNNNQTCNNVFVDNIMICNYC